MAERNLTDKQRRFCDEYLIDCNATQAAIRAGYSKRRAMQTGNELIHKPNIKAYIDAKLEEISSQKTADTKEILEYLTSVMRGRSKSEVVVVEGEGEGYSSARKVEKAPDEKEKLRAAELLGKYYGLYKEKVEHKASRVILVDSVPEDW